MSVLLQLLVPNANQLDSAVAVIWLAVVMAGAALCSLLVPIRWRLPLYLTLGLTALVLMRGPGAASYLMTDALIYGLVLAIASWCGPDRPARRWKCCWTAIIVLFFVFLLGRHLDWDKYRIPCGGLEWQLFNLDMLHVLILITFLWEIGSAQCAVPRFRHYVLWAVIPFRIMVLRYSQFDAQLQRMSKPVERHEFFQRGNALLVLLALGQFYALLVLRNGSRLLASASMVPHLGKSLTESFFIGPWDFYLISACAANLAVALAPSWNLTVPINWNRPFGRSNLSDFWMNWNMTATAVFRDYLFFQRWGLARPNVYVNTMVLFLVMGLWHGSNAYWVLFGLLHGLGFCGFIWFKQWKNLHPAAQRISGWPGQLLGAAVTYVFVCSCWQIPNFLLKRLAP